MLECCTSVDSDGKRFNIDISYPEPQGTCRALSRYDLWLRIPHTIDDFEVLFKVREIPRANSPRY